ncbi:protein of unknown function [Verrucomicrobium sp. GAS474]|uniref:DUF5069 domain-containing protein n=1 Tax=Verrucomicrobium sp. GAS474 TaxID=1882831 RepID=UPI0008796C6F|nr:DUF5069 domain-containing protein [Verrucomicrobium sp. GAS474]SDU18536.1 protein of unknown function [Verrucomicrobium sp. GAS474]
MNKHTTTRDLSQQAPHSPRDRISGFAIARRTLDKCRASLTNTLGEYHYDCPLDKTLFDFKGINGEQFTAAVRNSSDEEVGAWLQANGTPKTAAEIKAWSDEAEAASPMKNPERRTAFINNCQKLGLNPEKTTTFDWLDADDRESFKSKPASHTRLIFNS